MTQDQLAEKVGVDASAIRAIEAGRRGVSLESLVALGKALRCSPGELLGDEPRSRQAETELGKLVAGLEDDWQILVLELVRGIVARTGHRR